MAAYLRMRREDGFLDAGSLERRVLNVVSGALFGFLNAVRVIFKPASDDGGKVDDGGDRCRAA